MLEYLDSDTFIDYFQVMREHPHIMLHHNRYYNEELPAFRSYQNSLAFYVLAKVEKIGGQYRISAKFSLPHRVRQLNHQAKDLADVELPLFTKVYTNAINYSLQQNVNYEDGCLFKFWQEVYVGSFVRDGRFSETFQVIVQNTNYLSLAELSTLLSVLLAMVLMIWITHSTKDLTISPAKLKKD